LNKPLHLFSTTMLYLNQSDIEHIGIDWLSITNVIENTVKRLGENDFAQPIKPYLRYQDLKNRIIAMPAYVGGSQAMSGIKWIASFPGNVHKHLPRAHSVTILNEASSGKPLCAINTTLVSAIRTAGVSGLLVKEYLKVKPASQQFNVGIIGFGPIGQMHLSMVAALLGDRLNKVSLFDLRPVNVSDNRLLSDLGDKIEWVDSWESAYEDADIFITCTVSDHRYVDKIPKKGSLQLNVSLRDYTADFLDHVDMVVVDDWEEVCRENTDIDLMHREKGLQKESTRSIVDVVENQAFRDLESHDVIMFNPMGMAVFDIAIGGYYYQKASREKVGTVLMD